MKKTIVMKTALFLMVSGFVLSIVWRVLGTPGDFQNYQWIRGFYKEKENSLDAVYIGGSGVYSLWLSPVAWNEYGITVYPYTVTSQPLQVATYIFKETRKTQPNALYIININGLYDTISDKQIHWLTTQMPFSMNYFRTINYLCDVKGISFGERLEYYFPVLRFHSRWKELKKEDLHSIDTLKGGGITNWVFNGRQDVTSGFTIETGRRDLSDSLRESLEELLDYCDSEGIRVLFINTPQSIPNKFFWERINTISDLVQSRGYPCLNMLYYMDEINLDLKTDYADRQHTNIHGALKLTKFLGEYLVKNYGIKNKKGEAQYSDWDSAYKKYIDIIKPYVLDIEINYEKRDNTLVIPKLKNIDVNGTMLTINWEKSNGAEGYRVYRKEENSGWKMVAEVDAGALGYRDRKGIIKNKTYIYTVVPWKMENGKKAWGEFDARGIKAKALLDAPVMVSVNKVADGAKIVWKKVKGAAGYKVYRKLPDNDWYMIRDVGDTESYIDNTVMNNSKFIYTVSGYTKDKSNKIIDGSMNQAGKSFNFNI